MARTLLLLTYYFPPTAAVAVHRLLGYARFLPSHGWKLIVVAPTTVPGEGEDHALMQQVPGDTTIVRVPLPSGLLGKVARRLSSAMAWVPGAIRRCGQVIAQHRPDALLTSSPPPAVHYAGLYLKKRHGLPWVASLRDPWIANRQELTRWQQWEGLVEGRVFRTADAIVANTPLNLLGLQKAYPDCADKMVAITNGFDPERFPPRQKSSGSHLTLLHAGEIYSGRDPRPLLDALHNLARSGPTVDRPFRLDLLGRDTEGLCNLPEEIRRRDLEEKVCILDQAPYADALQRMVNADILVLIHSAGYRVGVPAKLYEYLGAGRPILALAEPDSDVAWVLRTSGVVHRLACPQDTEAIQQALIELREEIQAGTEPASGARLENFTRAAMVRKQARCLEAAVAAHRRRQPVDLRGLTDGSTQFS